MLDDNILILEGEKKKLQLTSLALFDKISTAHLEQESRVGPELHVSVLGGSHHINLQRTVALVTRVLHRTDCDHPPHKPRILARKRENKYLSAEGVTKQLQPTKSLT